jgi:hypothetical protein
MEAGGAEPMDGERAERPEMHAERRSTRGTEGYRAHSRKKSIRWERVGGMAWSPWIQTHPLASHGQRHGTNPSLGQRPRDIRGIPRALKAPTALEIQLHPRKQDEDAKTQRIKLLRTFDFRLSTFDSSRQKS